MMRRLVAVVVCSLIVPNVRTEEIRWPQFRGVDGAAVATDGKKLPVHFGPQKNVLWKTAVPEGFSSPCVWGERIFLTAYEPEPRKLETLCLERSSGRILWRRTAPARTIERVYKVNSPASATPTTDGRRVYVSFGSYGLLCYDFEGNEIWKVPLPIPKIGFGSATSPMLAGDMLLLNGQGADRHLLALRAATGEKVWQTDSPPFPSDYPVPVLWKHADVTEVIVPGRGGLLAYDLKDGSKRWWLPGLSPEACTTPSLGEGMLFVASHLPGGDPDLRMKLPTFDELLRSDISKDEKIDRREIPKDVFIFSRGGKEGVGDLQLHQMFWLFDRNGDQHIDRREWRIMLEAPFTNSLVALRPGGRGDVSDSHVAWQVRRGVPEVPSPLYYQGRIYLIRNGGTLTCLDARTGTEVFPRQRLEPGGMFYASPVAGDGKIYVCADAGVVTVIKAGADYQVLAENDLGEIIRATPALVDGKIYLRTARDLYALGE